MAEESGSEPVSRDSEVTLQEITEVTVGDILDLAVAPEQEQYVASNAYSLAQAHFSQKAWFRAIFADETPVGFVMLYQDPPNGTYFLWRLMIDRRYQGMGFGRKAVELLAAHVRSLPNADTLGASFVPGEGDPSGFYKKLGFVETGEISDGEVVVSLNLWSD